MCELTRIIDRYFDGDDCKKKEVCEKMGSVYPTFCRKTNPNDELTFNIREIIPYTLNTDFSLLDHIESRVGRVAFQIPKDGEKITTQKVADMIETMTKSISDMARIISDGVVDDDEKKKLNTLMIKLNQHGAGLHATINNK